MMETGKEARAEVKRVVKKQVKKVGREVKKVGREVKKAVGEVKKAGKAL
jgi:phage-related tail protein